MKKYITFTIPVEKQLDHDKTVTYKLKIFDSFRFMSISLLSLANRISDGLYKEKCTSYKSYRDYMSIKDDQQSSNQLILLCFKCKMNYNKDFNKKLITRFASTYEFCYEDINKFILLLRKGFYPYEYMDHWEKFNETPSPNKEDFYSTLNMEDMTDIDYRHAKRIL